MAVAASVEYEESEVDDELTEAEQRYSPSRLVPNYSLNKVAKNQILKLRSFSQPLSRNETPKCWFLATPNKVL